MFRDNYSQKNQCTRLIDRATAEGYISYEETDRIHCEFAIRIMLRKKHNSEYQHRILRYVDLIVSRTLTIEQAVEIAKATPNELIFDLIKENTITGAEALSICRANHAFDVCMGHNLLTLVRCKILTLAEFLKFPQDLTKGPFRYISGGYKIGALISNNKLTLDVVRKMTEDELERIIKLSEVILSGEISVDQALKLTEAQALIYPLRNKELNAEEKLSVAEAKKLASIENLIKMNLIDWKKALKLSADEFQILELMKFSMELKIVSLEDALKFTKEQAEKISALYKDVNLIAEFLSLEKVLQMDRSTINKFHYESRIELIKSRVISVDECLSKSVDDLSRLFFTYKLIQEGRLSVAQAMNFSIDECYVLSVLHPYISAGLITVTNALNVEGEFGRDLYFSTGDLINTRLKAKIKLKDIKPLEQREEKTSGLKA